MDIDKMITQMTLEEKASLCSGKDFWHTKGLERFQVPAMMMCDGPHGLRKQVGEGDHLGLNESIETVCYPTASALASSFDRGMLRKLGEALGKECQQEDVGMLLGPGINMKRSPLCGRNFEYFSEDPYLAGEMGSAFVEGIQSEGVAACAKHFAANNQETRRQTVSANIDERTLHEIYLPAFEAVVKKGKTRAVMCAYNAINGTFCAENEVLLTDILRKRWGYDGMVVTDWGAVKDRVKGVAAGLDLEMPGGSGAQDQAIVAAVRNGTLKEDKLNDAVKNVLRLVLDYKEQRKPGTGIDRAENAKLSREICEQCAVLLKNEGSLPMKKSDDVVFIGEFAEKPRYQGAGSSFINVPVVKGAMQYAAEHDYEVRYAQGYRKQDSAVDRELADEAVDLARTANAAVIFAGLPDEFETEGCDREHINLPVNQNVLIEAVAAVQPNTIVVLHGGSAMALPWIEKVSAVLCMHLGGQETGAATVRILYGEVNPSGKLAETWGMQLEDNPSYLNFPGERNTVAYREGIYIGYRYFDRKKMAVLFPFGYGLSYTTFAYSGLEMDKTEMSDRETLKVSCRVRNTGNRTGKESVQLYVGEVKSTVSRPIRELKAFEKIELEPGEEKEVVFYLEKRAFAYYETAIHDWFVESGTYSIEIGASSRDIRLKGFVEVNGTVELPMVYTYNSTIGDLMSTQKGQAVIQQMFGSMVGTMTEKEQESSEKAMGEGSAKMMRAMMQEMPLRSLVTFGRMTSEQLDKLLQMLNG